MQDSTFITNSCHLNFLSRPLKARLTPMKEKAMPKQQKEIT